MQTVSGRQQYGADTVAIGHERSGVLARDLKGLIEVSRGDGGDVTDEDGDVGEGIEHTHTVYSANHHVIEKARSIINDGDRTMIDGRRGEVRRRRRDDDTAHSLSTHGRRNDVERKRGRECRRVDAVDSQPCLRCRGAPNGHHHRPRRRRFSRHSPDSREVAPPRDSAH